ncbi:MAG: hypothetical protein H6R17_2351 [Proteobacteria bacterium]|nr:hypothetical protein [Pseudomonadota bacterium]
MSHINLDLQASHKMLMLLDEANVNTESVIDSIPGIFLIVNEDHEVLRANLEFIELLGLDSEDILRLPLSKLFSKESWKIFAHNIKQIVESGTAGASIRFEMGLATGDALDQRERTFHWTLVGRSTRNQGEGRLVTVFGDDISEMRETERRLQRVFTSIPLGIFTMNRDGTIGDSYSSYLESLLDCGKLAGTMVDDVLFKPALRHMTPDEIDGIGAIRQCVGKSVLDYGAYSRTFPQEIFHNTASDAKDGRWLKITYQPIVFDRIVEQLLIILEDRTAIVNAEREMLDAAQDREKAAALEKQSLARYEEAIRDPLTGLYTRLYMKDAVAALVWSHDHHEIPELSMAIFDIDHFKNVNDSHGHKNGDLILREVAEIILRQSPEVPIRFGGEEFLVFIPDSHEAAFALAERVRREVEAKRIDLGDAVIQVTISAGIATHRRDETLDDFMHRADQLLYRAKNNGRNQTMPEPKNRAQPNC